MHPSRSLCGRIARRLGTLQRRMRVLYDISTLGLPWTRSTAATLHAYRDALHESGATH